jgi:hypothetical protein
MSVNTATREGAEQAVAARSGLGYQILAFAEVLLLGGWLGAMSFFSFAVPQSGFAVLPSRQLVGLLVTSTITKVEVLGLVIGGILILIQLATWSARRPGRRARLILVGLMVLAAAASRFWITPEMVELRNAMGSVIENVPPTDPLKVQFDQLHGYSVGSLLVAMISGIVALFLTVRAWFKR